MAFFKTKRSARGFEIAEFSDGYGDEGEESTDRCSIQQSSVIGDYPEAFNKPGSSYLWLGPDWSRQATRMHLRREQVKELVQRMQAWLDTGSIRIDGET